MRLIASKDVTDLEYSKSVVEKWKPVTTYESKTLTKITDEDMLEISDILEKIEQKYNTNDELIRYIIPLIRKHGTTAYFEEGLYTPTESQPYHGHTFKAVKFVNPDQYVSKFIAIPLDPKYNAISKFHSIATGVIRDYGYTFDF